MAQAKKKKQKKRLQTKYVLRRFLLVLIVLGAAGMAAWIGLNSIGEQLRGKKNDEITPVTTAPDTDEEENEQPFDEKDEQSEPDPAPEPEPPPDNDLEWNLILANDENPLPADFEVEELVDVGSGFKVDARIADSVMRMFAKAKEDGINLMVCSAYRSIELQTTNFNNKVQEYLQMGYNEEEAVAETAAYIAVPGHSEHHTGLALDIVTPSYQNLDDGFEETGAFRWLYANAADFGFILRYPKHKAHITGISYEPWHYRYVGVEHAQFMKESDRCLEEYIHIIHRDQKRSAEREQEDESGGEEALEAEEQDIAEE